MEKTRCCQILSDSRYSKGKLTILDISFPASSISSSSFSECQLTIIFIPLVFKPARTLHISRISFPDDELKYSRSKLNVNGSLLPSDLMRYELYSFIHERI